MVQEPVEENVNSVHSVNKENKGVKIETRDSKKYTEKESLQCVFLNARGLLGKLEELKVLAMEKALDIIGITETWLTGDVDNAEIAMEGYTVFRRDRYEVKMGKHGGVALYVRDKVVTRECSDLNKSKSESVWCRIMHKRSSTVGVVVGVCY
jgi:hypothetical protein